MIIPDRKERQYVAPSVRVVVLKLDAHVLSNTEPIVDDGQEHGWD